MPLAQQVLAINNDFPIRTHHPVHSGKVRAVYWLSKADSQRLIEEKNYQVPYQTELAVMIISDRLSAFDCLWHGENDLHGVPGKGAALNAISAHWFEQFKKHGLADSHLLDMPHPLVWIVQKAQPIKIEAIGRRYITGSLWRSYEKGERSFCGHSLPEGLHQHQALDELLVTPSTKGVLKNIPDVPELDDVSIVNQTVAKHYQAFGFKHEQDVEHYQGLLKAGFEIISDTLVKAGQILVDTKFEFGYVKDASGKDQLIYMDEVGTPDSSRFWEYKAYQDGKIIENSKEGFRQFLLNNVNDPNLLLNANRMDERANYAKETALPTDIIMTVSETYRLMAEKITGQSITISANPREEIIETLHQYELLK